MTVLTKSFRITKTTLETNRRHYPSLSIMATFQIRDNGKITVKVRRHGKTASETFASKSNAEAWARKTESLIEQGLWSDTSKAKSTTIKSLINDYREKWLPTLKGHGVSSALNILEERLGRHKVSDLTNTHISEYKDNRLKEVGNETVRKEMSTLSRMIDLAISESEIKLPFNPCKLVKKPKPGKSRTRRLLAGEEELLTTQLRRCKSLYMLPIFKFALETAGRQGEIVDLLWKNVDKEARTCLFVDTKNGDDREVPLSSAALAIIENVPRKPKEERVFPVSTDLVKRAWANTVSRAREKYEMELLQSGSNVKDLKLDIFLTDLHFHDLRHEAISRLAERDDLNLSTLELASITGHKTLQMLKRYAHLRNASKIAFRIG